MAPPRLACTAILGLLLFACVADAFFFDYPTSKLKPASLKRQQQKRGSTPFTRVQAIDCILRCVDGLYEYKDRLGRVAYNWTVKDGCVNVTEIRAAKNRYLTDAEKLLTEFVKSDEQILFDCDYDGTARSVNDKAKLLAGCISRQDMVESVDMCIKDQDKLDILKDKICDRCDRYQPAPPK
jgi:hypothetical protein